MLLFIFITVYYSLVYNLAINLISVLLFLQSLFHVIVDTDATAAFFMKELDRRKAGRLTFLPLNRLRNPPVTYPDSNDVRPLMSIALEYEPNVEEAVKQV